MEIQGLSSRIARSERPTPPVGGAVGAAPTNPVTEAVRQLADRVTFSTQRREETEAASPMDPDWIRQQVESANDQAEAQAKALDAKRRCMLIASRILAGDKVPTEDLRYLSNNDMELYALAISMRRNNPDPKDHDRVSEDEEETAADQAGPVEGGSGEAAAPAPAPAPEAPAVDGGTPA